MHDFPPHQGGRGLRFTKDVCEGDVVLRVPHRAMLTGARARSLLPEGLLDSLADAGLRGAPSDDALAFSLVIMLASMAMKSAPSHLGEAGHALDPEAGEAEAGDSEAAEPGAAGAAKPAGETPCAAAHPGARAAAQLGPWIRVQPRPNDLGGLPVAWGDDELLALGKHSSAYRQATGLKVQWHAEWEALRGWLAAGGAAVDASEGDWWWARACARSRVFLDGLDDGGDVGGGMWGQDAGGGEGSGASEGGASERGGEGLGWGAEVGEAAPDVAVGLVMVPLADMMNHSPWDPLGEEEEEEEEEQGIWELWAEHGFDAEAVPPACATDWEDDDEAEADAEEGEEEAGDGDCAGAGGGGGGGGGWFVVRASTSCAAGTQCCISYDCGDLSATLGTYGFTPVPADRQPDSVGGTPGTAAAAVLGPVLARLTEDVAMPELAELNHWSSEAAPGPAAAAGALEAAKREALLSLGVDVPEPPTDGRPPAPPATLALPAVAGGLPAWPLALLRVACAATAEEVAALRSAAVEGSAAGCCASAATERRALEALARMCARCCGSCPLDGEAVSKLAQAAAQPALRGRRLDAARSSVARTVVAWSCTIVARAGLAALSRNAHAADVALRDAALMAAPASVRLQLEEFVQARADVAE